MAAAGGSGPDVNLLGLEGEAGPDSEPDSEVFSCVAHCSDLACRQNEQRLLGLFCDVTLAFSAGSNEEEGEVSETSSGSDHPPREFRAHRSILAAATEYFAPLLLGDFAESRSGRVELRKWSSGAGPDPETIEAVISFMYTGSVRVSPGNVHEVLELADRFLLIRLKEFCGEFLKKKLSLSNSVAIHSLAHMYSLNQLALKAAEMIRRNFYKVIQDEEFYTLPFPLIRDWLSDSEITVDSEEVLFEMVLKWVQRNPEEREKYFGELFKLLRLSQIKPTYLTRHVKSEKLVSSNEACLKLVMEAVESHALKGENVQLGTLQQVTSPISSLPRFGQNMDVIMVIGGVSEGGDYLSECVGYFIDEDRWVSLPHTHNHLDGHAVVVTESYLYVAGSMEPGFAKTMERSYPLDHEEAKRKISSQVSDDILESLPPEVLSIEGAAICYYKDDIFIIGGWKNSDDTDKQYRKEAYRYCAEKKRWFLLPPMPQARCRATACHVRIPFRSLHGTQKYPMPQNLMWQKDRIRQMQKIHRHSLCLRRMPRSQIEC
ncbi:kelch-like 11 [Crotalus adamanteus]|uniref:Kelch-like 11 n=1 Tax=Crotalus adamanteus TaxID=8729 RepID=A0AAW1B449_CROAD